MAHFSLERKTALSGGSVAARAATRWPLQSLAPHGLTNVQSKCTMYK